MPRVWELEDNFWGGSTLNPTSWAWNQAVSQAWAASTLPFGAILLAFQFTFCSHHCISPAPFARTHGQQHQAARVLQAVWESWFLELHHILASALLLKATEEFLLSCFLRTPSVWNHVSFVGSLLFLEDLHTSQRN